MLAVLGIVLAVLALGGFWLFRREALAAARGEAQSIAPGALREYMYQNGRELVAESLDSGEVVATLQRRLQAYGLDDIEQAVVVDTDADWTESPA